MDNEMRLTIFWIVHLATLGLFIVGLFAIVAMWLKAKVPGLPAGPRGGASCGPGSVLSSALSLAGAYGFF